MRIILKHLCQRALKPAQNRISMNKKNAIIGVSLLLASLLFFKSFVAMLLLIAIGAFSVFYKRWITLDLDFELYTFAAIVAGFSYGPAAGAIVGAAATFVGLIINLQFFRNIIFTLIRTVSIAIIGYFASYISLNFLIIYAVIITLVMDAIFCVLAGSMGGNPANLVLYAITHTLIVYGLLRAFLPQALAIIT